MNTKIETSIILPADPAKIVAVCAGKRWLFGIQPGSVKLTETSISFDIRWNSTGQLKHYTLALDLVSGYEEST